MVVFFIHRQQFWIAYFSTIFISTTLPIRLHLFLTSSTALFITNGEIWSSLDKSSFLQSFPMPLLLERFLLALLKTGFVFQIEKKQVKIRSMSALYPKCYVLQYLESVKLWNFAMFLIFFSLMTVRRGINVTFFPQ